MSALWELKQFKPGVEGIKIPSLISPSGQFRSSKSTYWIPWITLILSSYKANFSVPLFSQLFRIIKNHAATVYVTVISVGAAATVTATTAAATAAAVEIGETQLQPLHSGRWGPSCWTNNQVSGDLRCRGAHVPHWWELGISGTSRDMCLTRLVGWYGITDLVVHLMQWRS